MCKVLSNIEEQNIFYLSRSSLSIVLSFLRAKTTYCTFNYCHTSYPFFVAPLTLSPWFELISVVMGVFEEHPFHWVYTLWWLALTYEVSTGNSVLHARLYAMNMKGSSTRTVIMSKEYLLKNNRKVSIIARNKCSASGCLMGVHMSKQTNINDASRRGSLLHTAPRPSYCGAHQALIRHTCGHLRRLCYISCGRQRALIAGGGADQAGSWQWVCVCASVCVCVLRREVRGLCRH